MIAPDLLARFDTAVRYGMPAGLSADETRAVRDALRRVEALEAALRDVEWAGQDDHEDGGYVDCCPSCGAERAAGRHYAGCQLAAALAAAPCPTCHETDCQPIEETRT